jgi:hypothetical protein
VSSSNIGPLKINSAKTPPNPNHSNNNTNNNQGTTSTYTAQDDANTKQAESGYGCCDYMLIGLSYLLGILFFPIFILMSIKIVKEYERAVIMRLGRIRGGAKGPGLFRVLPCIDTIQIVDLRTLTFNVPPQEILTKDSVTVVIDAVCYFRTFNPVIAVIQVENATNATR